MRNVILKITEHEANVVAVADSAAAVKKFMDKLTKKTAPGHFVIQTPADLKELSESGKLSMVDMVRLNNAIADKDGQVKRFKSKEAGLEVLTKLLETATVTKGRRPAAAKKAAAPKEKKPRTGRQSKIREWLLAASKTKPTSVDKIVAQLIKEGIETDEKIAKKNTQLAISILQNPKKNKIPLAVTKNDKGNMYAVEA